jgi:hypothetical protein
MKHYLIEMFDGNKYQIKVGNDRIQLGFHPVRMAHFIFEVISCKSIKCRFPTDDFIEIGNKLISFEKSPIITSEDFTSIYESKFSPIWEYNLADVRF